MMPVYRDMNSYPHQMSPQGYYRPGYGNCPHQMGLDSSMPVSCEYWPNGGGHGFPVPYHGCCMQGNIHGCNGFRPFYLPQVRHHPCCGSYSGFHPVHHPPAYYIPPQSPFDHQPRFEYDKDLARDRGCSGCVNHVSDRRIGNGVRIEEHEPETQKESRGKTVVPAPATDFPYPIVWVPREGVRNQDHEKPVGSERRTPDEARACKDTKVSERNGRSPPLFPDALRSLLQNRDKKHMENGQKVVFPCDFDKLNSLLQGQDGEGDQSQRNGAESGQFPYQIFLIPSQGNSQEDKQRGDTEAAQRQTEEGLLPLWKVFPFNLLANADQSAKPEGKEGNFERSVTSDTIEKHAHDSPLQNFREQDDQKIRQRIIPVKQSEDQGEKSTEKMKRVIENKSGESTMKKQSSSPPKSSKLPPVCLRVDPLPKKKNGNGRTRSPSPPIRKVQSSRTVEECTKLQASPSSKKEEPDKSGAKAMSEIHLNAAGSEKQGTESEVNPEKEVEKVQNTPDKEVTRGDEAVNRQKPVKKTFSSDEAARVIQSGYRGYEVRRWEPLKKLKQMAKIREQMLDVKTRIQAIEGSTDHQSGEKEIAVVGEMVISLLLKLDAIQGLHPSIRDVRKSLAKELLSLQEKLDSLKKSRAMMEDVFIAKQVETTGEAVEDKTCSETSEGQLAEEHGKVSDPITEEFAVPLPASSDPLTTIENETSQQVSASIEEDPKLVQMAMLSREEDVTPTTETRDELSSCDSDAAPKADISEVLEADGGVAETSPSVHPPSADEKETTVTGNEKVQFVEESLEMMKELPQHVEGDEPRTLARDENRNAEAVANMLEITDSSLPLEDNAELLELPIGVIDEEQQDSSHAEVQKSSPCTLEASTDPRSEPVMVPSDSEPVTEVGQQKEEETGYTNEDTTVKEGDNSVEAPPESMDGEPAAVKPEALTDNDQPNDRLESIEQNSQKGIAEQNVIMDAEMDKTQVEGGEPTPTETWAVEEETAGRDKKLMEENQKLREAMEKLMEAGREQMQVISSLSGRVKTLEKKLSRKKKVHARRQNCGKTREKRIKNKGPNTEAVM